MSPPIRWFHSYRLKLQVSLLLLGLLAIGTTYWQASTGAMTALRQGTYDRLTAIRETKRRTIEEFFVDLHARILALSSDDSTLVALEQFGRTWRTLPGLEPVDPRSDAVLAFYRDVYAPAVGHLIGAQPFLTEWLPVDPRTVGAQYLYLANNPHPEGARDLLLAAAGAGDYGLVHERYHPTFHRYLTAFDFYDIFLIDAREGRILYTVSKEIDLGMLVTAPPYRDTALGRAYDAAMALTDPDRAILTDYAAYMPSRSAPAAFMATPVWRAGEKIGVIAIQVSIERVNRVMTGDRHWQDEGLGRTGQAYIVGKDWTLRSDLRVEIEQPEAFFTQLRSAPIASEAIERIRRNGTAILNLEIPHPVSAGLPAVGVRTEIGRNVIGTEVVRSYAPLQIGDLEWMVFAEMDVDEAFAPVASLRRRLLATGTVITLAFVAAAWLLSRSITGPLLALAEGARRLGARDFGVRLDTGSPDEIGFLAESFNHMTRQLEHTTVSRDDLERLNQQLSAKQQQLEELTARLISAQEEERARLARELHDDLTQRLAAVAIAAGALRRRDQVSEPDWRRGVQQIQQQLAELSDDVHALSRRLHPKTLEDLGLVAAIESECRGFFERSGVVVDFRHPSQLPPLAPDVQLALYRIVQEALRNVARHSGATDVEVTLEARGDEVRLEIADNGSGFDRDDPAWRRGLGLASMEERARLMRGTMTVAGGGGAGTRIAVSVPASGGA